MRTFYHFTGLDISGGYNVQPTIPQSSVTIWGLEPGLFCAIVNVVHLLLVALTLVWAFKEKIPVQRKVLNVLLILIFPVIGPILYIVLRGFVSHNFQRDKPN